MKSAGNATGGGFLSLLIPDLRGLHVGDVVEKLFAFSLVAVLFQWVKLAYQILLLMPLEQLYLRGPHLHGYGFWGGRPLHDICSELTKVDSQFWVYHHAECLQVVEAHFYSLVTFLQVLLYMWALLKSCSCIWGSIMAWLLALPSKLMRQRQQGGGGAPSKATESLPNASEQ